MGVHERQAERVVGALFDWAIRPPASTLLRVDETSRAAVLELAPRLDEVLPDPPLVFVVEQLGEERGWWDLARVSLLAQFGALRDDWHARGVELEPLPLDCCGPAAPGREVERFATALGAIVARIESRRVAVALAPPRELGRRLAGELRALLDGSLSCPGRYLVVALGGGEISVECGAVVDLRIDRDEQRSEMLRALRAAGEDPTSVRAHGGAGPAVRVPDVGGRPAYVDGARAEGSRDVARALVATLEGRHRDAVTAWEGACATLQRSGAREAARQLRVVMAGSLAATGDALPALTVLAALRDEAQASGDSGSELSARIAASGIAFACGNPEGALVSYGELASRALALGAPDLAIDALRVRGELQCYLGRVGDAAASWRRALEIAETANAAAGGAPGVADRLGDLCARHGLSEEAARYRRLGDEWRARARGGPHDAGSA